MIADVRHVLDDEGVDTRAVEYEVAVQRHLPVTCDVQEAEAHAAPEGLTTNGSDPSQGHVGQIGAVSKGTVAKGLETRVLEGHVCQ